jgi:two-component SAPR family response regulator
MIQTIVVDDEWYSMKEICDMVESTGFMNVQGQYQNGLDALREAAFIHPQAAFIDIEMPEMDGITLAEKLLEADPSIKIVFITGWNQYAVAAFELNALDYIMKPVNKARFDKMAERLQNEFVLSESAHRAELTIRCFGRFEVLKNELPIVWQRTKAEELFAFLIINENSFIHKDIILENLWPDYERSKSLPILQTSVCKIRNVFSACKDAVKLTYADNKYGLFLSNVDCDFIFVRNALQNFESGKPKTYGNLRSACPIFEKGLLSYNGYLWSEFYSEGIRHKLVTALSVILTASSPKEAPDLQDLLSRISLEKEIR